MITDHESTSKEKTAKNLKFSAVFVMHRRFAPHSIKQIDSVLSVVLCWHLLANKRRKEPNSHA
jgi:hypothetical protein